MHLYFIFSKNVNFFQDLKYYVHFEEGMGKMSWKQQRGSFPLPFLFSPPSYSYCRENRTKAICLQYTLVQLGKGYSTNATLYLTISHLNHHDGNLKSGKGNSPSSGQVLLLSEFNGWRFALILLHGLQPQQQNLALQFRLTKEEYALTVFLPNLVANHRLRLAILIL